MSTDPIDSTAAPPETLPADNAYRNRLLDGMASSVAQKGYADTTVADIVRFAGMSKRTFYEHFASKNECMIALYQAASHGALVVLRDAIDPARDWEIQVDHALKAYFGCLASNPMLLRTLFIEILGQGVEGLAVRRKVNQELADFIVQKVSDGGRHPLRDPALTASMAMAVVGGINELVLQALEENRADALVDLVAPASVLVRSVLLPLR
ncbi:MAG: TetR/AcrR family transcriptional regulator [Pseudomonadota bacterium]